MCIHSPATTSVTITKSVASPSSSDGNITSLKTAPTVLPASHSQALRSESTVRPDSVSAEPSQLNKTEEATEQRATSADSERIQSTRSTSNQHSNKTKAKVHFGACSIGALTFGILAGPVGLVFAPAYLNAICMAMYGGHEFFSGETPLTRLSRRPRLQNLTSPMRLPVTLHRVPRVPISRMAQAMRKKRNPITTIPHQDRFYPMAKVETLPLHQSMHRTSRLMKRPT